MKPITILFFLILVFTRTNSQSDSSKVKNIIAELNTTWFSFHYKNLIQNDSSDINQVRNFFYTKPFIPNANNTPNLQMSENSLRSQILKRDWGLKFTSGYLQNFNPSFNDDDNLIYNSRWQAGLSWDILNSGIYENRVLARAKELENLILQSVALPGSNNEELTVKWNQIIYRFNLQKLEILEQRMTLVKKQNQCAQDLFLIKFLSKELFLENEKRLAEIQSMLNIYRDFNAQLKQIGVDPGKDAYNLPLLDIQYEKMFPSTTNVLWTNDTLLSYIMQKNILEEKYLSRLNLSTFVRYNYYNLVITNPATRSFMSAGVNLSVPITFNNKLHNEHSRIKSLNEYEKLTQTDDTRQAERLDDSYEFRYKLKQYVVFYQKKILFTELLRKETARYSLDPISFNPYKAISLQDDILAIDMELVELKQEMYLKLLKIMSHGTLAANQSIFYPYLLNENVNDSLNLRKHIYAWSTTFTNYDSSFVKEYLLYHDMRSIALSVGNDANVFPTLIATNASIRHSGIETELLIGDNKFPDKKVTDYFSKNTVSVKSVSALHIDYEPHTFSDWNEKKFQYMQLYYQKLKEARQFCDENKIKLIISVPLHFPEEDMLAMIELCDVVVFMAYENVKNEHIIGKISKYLGKKEKLAIAFRTNDFSDRSQMENKMKEIAAQTRISNFYIHDLGRCIEWDEKAIDK